MAKTRSPRSCANVAFAREPAPCIPVGNYCSLRLHVVTYNVFIHFYAAPVKLSGQGKLRSSPQLALRNPLRIKTIQTPHFSNLVESNTCKLPGGMASELCNTDRPAPVHVDSSSPQIYAWSLCIPVRHRREWGRARNAGQVVSSNHIWPAFRADNLRFSDKVAPRRLLCGRSESGL
jgi:hypothetical protein